MPLAAARLAAALAVCLVLAAAAPAPAPGSPATPVLARRGALGVGTADTTDGVAVTTVLPGSAAEGAGLRAGDLLKTVDGAAVAANRDFLPKLRRAAGQAVVLGILRAGAPSTVSVVLTEAPKEIDPLVDTRYEAVEVDGTLRRTLITVPHNADGKHPAVLFVGGIGCYSVDVATNPQDPYTRLAHDMSRRGFVTLRLEKSGVGDSAGPPCPTVDYLAEAASYTVAYDALARDPSVDANRIYLFGHSIGTIIAPRLALQRRAAGIIAADGVGRGWIEYELINTRRQLVLAGATPAEVDQAMLGKVRCIDRLLLQKQDEKTIERDEPDCAQHNVYPAPAAYFQQLASLDAAAPWMKVAVPVLAIYGSADFITDEADHQRIVGIVNGVHPGSARLEVIPGMDHYLTPAGTQQASFDRVSKHAAAPYDERLSTAVTAWLCEREHCG
jgi:alpha-beta hydrolase superfamily lysophospholipase